MICQRCKGNRIADISGKTSDCFSGEIDGKDYDGYVPSDMGIGGSDYIEFAYCLDCGQIQGKWPVHPNLDKEDEDDENYSESYKDCRQYIYPSKGGAKRV